MKTEIKKNTQPNWSDELKEDSINRRVLKLKKEQVILYQIQFAHRIINNNRYK
ncbi:hypothetical protein PcPA57_03550 [Pasteurella canis]|nr:hypothetical protein PcPA57_03550 [Pasteurella canis]